MKHITGISSNVSIIRIIIVAILLLLSVMMIYSFQVHNFVRTEAEIIANNKVIDLGRDSDNKISVIKIVKCCYEYENDKYESSYRTFLKKYSKGDKVIVYVNPDNPSEIKNPFIYEACIIGILFLVCFITLFTISQRKKYEK